jgi:hypothetical protein
MKTENYIVNGHWNSQSIGDSTGTAGGPFYGSWVDHGLYFVYSVDNQEISVNTPGFHKLKPYQFPENPYHKHIKSESKPRLAWTTNWLYASGRLDKQVNDGPASVFGSFADSDESLSRYPGEDPTNQAISRLQSQLRQSSGSLLVTMAEADKTASHIAHTATRLVNAYRDLRKGRLGDFAKNLGLTTKVHEVRAYRNQWRRKSAQGSDLRQFAASTWLEYSYGWKPLLSDVYAQAENLARYMTNNGYVVREAKASAHAEKVYEELKTEPNLYYKTRKRVVVSNRVSYTVRYRIQDGANKVANTFGLSNPALVAWELVPFSFVADWFLPIGDFLDNLTAYNGLEFAGGTKGTVRKADISCVTSNGPGSGTNPRIWFDPFEFTCQQPCYYKWREVLTGFPSQSLPSFKDPRSFAHAASAIALIQSVFQGSRMGAVRFR